MFIGNGQTLRSGTQAVNGVATLQKRGAWGPVDPFFDKVTLLLQHTSLEGGVSDKSLYRRRASYNNSGLVVPINTAHSPAWAGMKSIYLANGGTEYIAFPDSADWTPYADFTIDVVYWTNGAGGDGVLFQHGGYNTDKPAWALVSRPDGHAYGRIGTNASTTILDYANSDTSAPLNFPHHLVLQRSGNVYSFGIDGNFTTQLTLTGSPWDAARTATLGADSSAAGLFLGEIYAVRKTLAARYAGTQFPSAVTGGPFPTR